MIYLIQDCYEDQEGNFHRILKIGYSFKIPKATDLGKYFKLTKTKVTLSDKTITNGFKLEIC